ncbi:MAG: hypothetical protein QXS21_05430 [Thermoproteota archaeon]
MPIVFGAGGVAVEKVVERVIEKIVEVVRAISFANEINLVHNIIGFRFIPYTTIIDHTITDFSVFVYSLRTSLMSITDFFVDAITFPTVNFISLFMFSIGTSAWGLNSLNLVFGICDGFTPENSIVSHNYFSAFCDAFTSPQFYLGYSANFPTFSPILPSPIGSFSSSVEVKKEP